MRFESAIAMRLSSRRVTRIANDQRLATLCHSRVSKWADATREGLDPDIARFMQDQAAAWQLLADSYSGCPETAL